MANETWDAWWPELYSEYEKPKAYPGSDDSYEMAGEYLAGNDTIEEWGCATTWGKQFLDSPYRGVDGGPSEWVDEVADLTTYRSKADKILIRHVLEHNWEWRQILQNVVGSFQDRAVIILFIPLGTHDINRSFEHRADKAPSPPGLQMDEESFWYELRNCNLYFDTTLSNNTPPFGYERVIGINKNGEPNIPFVDPRCRVKGCTSFAQGQIHSDYVVLDNKFEWAFNTCLAHQEQALKSLYSLQVPELVVFND